MNSSAYIFGQLSSGYTQYPDESASLSIFNSFYSNAKAVTQIAIHRDGNLMYYAYIRKLENSKYLGLCVLLNGVMVTHFDGMFSFFESIISNLVTKGYLIKFDEYGNLIPNTERLYMKREEVELVTESLIHGFDNGQFNYKKLPPEDYAVNKNSIKEFSVKDDTSDILKSSHTNGFTYIYKSEGYNTAQMNSYQGILSKLNKENDSLKKENNELKNENSKIRQQKKQFQYVILLFIAVIGCGIGLLLLNKSLNKTQSELEEANNTISSKDMVINENKTKISELNSQISTLQSSLADETNKRENTEKELDDLRNSISSSFPIIISDIEIANIYSDGSIETNYGSSIYSSSSMYLKPRITYTGIRTGETITLYAKLYGISGSIQRSSSSPNGYTFSNSLIISEGSGNTFEMSGWGGSNKGFWSRGSYRYEIWYGNSCLKSKTFSVY